MAKPIPSPLGLVGPNVCKVQMAKSSPLPLPEFRLTTVTTSPFEPRRRSRTFEENERLRRVREHLEDNISQRLPLAEAARIAGFESTYFSSYFRKKVGITYVRWMNALRIAHAIELLRISKAEIGAISKTVGYSDLRTFERNFSRLTGQTPSAFRKQALRRQRASYPEPGQRSQTTLPSSKREQELSEPWFDPDAWDMPTR